MLAHAHQVVQTLAVSAQVSPSATIGLEVVAQPLEIKQSDLERGYVDVVMKSRMRGAKSARTSDARPAVAMAMETPAGKTTSARAANATITKVVEDTTQGEYAEFRYRVEFSRAVREGGPGTISVAVDL
jgi:hypothetical protein